VQGGELGAKYRSPDRSLTMELAAIITSTRGLQVGANEPPQADTSAIILKTLNAGAAKVYGLISISTTVRHRLKISACMQQSLEHARFTKLTNVPCWGGQLVSEGCNLLPVVYPDDEPYPDGRFLCLRHIRQVLMVITLRRI